jgi:hypothetical protein
MEEKAGQTSDHNGDNVSGQVEKDQLVTLLPIKKNELDPSKMTDEEIEAASGDLMNVANMIAFGSGMAPPEPDVVWKEVSIQEYVNHGYKELQNQLHVLQGNGVLPKGDSQNQVRGKTQKECMKVDEHQELEQGGEGVEFEEQVGGCSEKVERMRLTAKTNYNNLHMILDLDIEEGILNKDDLAQQLHVEQQLSAEMEQARQRKNAKLKQRLESRRRQKSAADPPQAPALTA